MRAGKSKGSQNARLRSQGQYVVSTDGFECGGIWIEREVRPEGRVSNFTLCDQPACRVENGDRDIVKPFRAAVIAVEDHDVIDWRLVAEINLPPGVLLLCGAGARVESAVRVAVDGHGSA